MTLPMIRIALFSGLMIASIGAASAQQATVQGCLYPNGWNVTDFDRDIQGIPTGESHQCLVVAPEVVHAGAPHRHRA